MPKGLLEGKLGIISGALDDKSIAWKVAERCFAEGGRFILTNAPIALRFGKINELAAKCSTDVIAADATNMDELRNLFTQSMSKLGGKIDFVLHAIGMSMNVRKNKAYTELNHEFMLKTLDISAISFHKIMQVGWELDAFNAWGSIVGLSYIAAQRVFPSYSEMAEAKALLESITRSFGYHLGKAKKVRVNTISQSPTPTTAGSGVKGFDAFLQYAEKMSPLGNATAEECAEYCVMLFSDYTRKVTMQNLFHDGGFSMTGVSEEVISRMG